MTNRFNYRFFLKLFSKYSVCSLIELFVYSFIFIVLYELFKFTAVYSSIMSFFPTVTVGFFIKFFWVFKENNNKINFLHSVIKYWVQIIFGSLLNTSMIYISIEILGLWFLYGQISAILSLVLFNFFVAKLWVFK
jgi:putative flippase GtrA